MREIIFRGKDVNGGGWKVGFLTRSYRPTGYYASWHIEVDKVVMHYLQGTERTMQPYKVIPETVGQYTGLTDKNGKRIFEGDIIAGAAHWLERMKNGVAAFKDGSFGLVWYRGNVEQFNPFTSMCNIEYEVIGNIHDNPELLEVQI